VILKVTFEQSFHDRFGNVVRHIVFWSSINTDLETRQMCHVQNIRKYTSWDTDTVEYINVIYDNVEDSPSNIDRKFEFYDFFSFLKFNEF